jgi:hypothetical protein
MNRSKISKINPEAFETNFRNYKKILFLLENSKTSSIMATINVYECYYKANLVANGVQRKAALVMLIATSEEGHIRYEAAVTFFPFSDPTDFSITYDAYYSKILHDDKGRRSKKREKLFLDDFQTIIDNLAKEAGGEIYWNEALLEDRFA